jgi:hypothetical protein
MKQLLLFAILITPLYTYCQDDKRDYVWVVGAPLGPPVYQFGGAYINFNTNPPDTTFFDIRHYLETLTTVCDKNGQLSCYSNSCEVVNKYEETIANGDDISAGWAHDAYCDNIGYSFVQSVILLPYPGKENQYALLHHTIGLVGMDVAAPDFLYSIIDMNAENGRGRVLEKNQILQQGSLSGYVNATRHGNGRDWWIVVSDSNGKRYYTYLLSPNGIEGPTVQTLYSDSRKRLPTGQVGFSPDGSWFAGVTNDSLVRLIRFDRCSGTFYDPQTFEIDFQIFQAGGVAFSPNSRFLYVTTPLQVNQYDLQAPSIYYSRYVVAEYDGFTHFNGLIATTFFQAMLAPDNKIYMTCTNGTWFFHTIDQPDSLGVACQVNQHSFELPVAHSFSVPNFPYYRLYDLQGSVCDSLGIDGPVSAAEPPRAFQRINVYPNPVQDILYLSAPTSANWTIADIQGRVLQTGITTEGVTNIPVGTLQNGVYVLTIRDEQGMTQTRRFVVAR